MNVHYFFGIMGDTMKEIETSDMIHYDFPILKGWHGTNTWIP